MTPEILNFTPGSLVEADKYIKVTYVNFVTAKETVEFEIKIHEDNVNPSLLRHITYYLHQTYAIDYFPSLS